MDKKMEGGAGTGALDSTNVTICFFQQARFFTGWWAASEAAHHVGLASRFLFGFGSSKNPGPVELNRFATDVVFPIVKDIFKLTLLTLGPKKAVGGQSPVRPWTLDAVHEEFSRNCRLVCTAKTKKCRSNGVLIDGLKKVVFWSAQGALMTSLVNQLFFHSCAGTPLTLLALSPTISKESLHCGVSLFVRRYLFGLAPLDGDIDKRTWMSRRTSVSALTHKATLHRVLRLCLSEVLTTHDLVVLGVPFTDELGRKTEETNNRALLLFQDMSTRGLGNVVLVAGLPAFRKLPRERLDSEAEKLLREIGTPGSHFGTQNKEESAPAVVVSKETKAPGKQPLEENWESLLVRKQLTGSFLTTAGVRDQFREVMQQHRLAAAIHQVKARTRHIVLYAHCSQGQHCPVHFRCLYFLKNGRFEAKEFVVCFSGEHAANRKRRIWSLTQAESAQAFLQQDEGLWNPRSLEQFLRGRGHQGESLPSKKQRREWIRRNRTATPVEAEAPSQQPVVAIAEENIQRWQRSETTSDSGLFVASPHVISGELFFVPVTCSLMRSVARRFCGPFVNLGVDTKMSTLTGGGGIASVALLVKGGLSNTTFCRTQGRRLQGEAWTTTCLPLVQAAISTESTPAYVLLFDFASRVWRDETGTPLHMSVRQVHKDLAGSIEAARRQCFPKSRPCNDFAHFTRALQRQVPRLCQHAARTAKGEVVKKHFRSILQVVTFLHHVPACFKPM